ncbi:MAG: PocR ligand-binding domain-containing protein [Candidatus Omnitrophota bacterium]
MESQKNYSEGQFYGDLTKLNTCRVLADSVSRDVLIGIVNSYLDLLNSSSAVYEINGDYALGIFSSGWCRFLDEASRRLCGTDDNKKALDSGLWLCHESCWKDAAKVSIEKGEPVDIECHGGIRLYAVPIKAGKKIVGSINFGYSDPPQDSQKLQEIAKKYNVDQDKLHKLAMEHKTCTPSEIEAAKKHLQTTAMLIGEIVRRKEVEDKLNEEMENLETFNKAAIGRELKMVELKEEIQQLKQKLKREL